LAGERLNAPLVRDEVYRLLWRAILQGDLRPGDRIIESRLAREFSLSQTPVREAIQQLARQGLVVTLARSGTFVREMSVADIIDVYAVREALESLAVRSILSQPVEERGTDDLAAALEGMFEGAERDNLPALVECDMQFHGEVFALSRNRALPSVAAPLLAQTAAFASVTNLVHFESLTDVAASHIPLLTLLRSGTNPEEGARVVREHLMTVLQPLQAHAKTDAS
jgi:DNA-binding GntR family transcriptional regulator